VNTHTIKRLILCIGFAAAPLAAATCESLTGLKLVKTRITASHVVAPGAFRPPGNPPNDVDTAVYKTLPSFCRVEGVIEPTSDSHIEFEVWLPSSGWNGNYLGVGNGGFAGSINYLSASNLSFPGMAPGLMSGFSMSSTDTGHRAWAGDANWGLGHPEKVIDYGYRAIHETAVQSKAIIRAFYGAAPKKSYFDSCSNGGRQALMEAQRYPADYDGILAGAPSYYNTHGTADYIWNVQALMMDPASHIRPVKLPAIQVAALAACDANDGIKDGVIDDPSKCNFDPGVLLCGGAETDACLTQPQIVALKKIYAGPRNSKGEQIFPGMMPGAETGPQAWSLWITSAQPEQSGDYFFGVGTLAKLVYQDPAWDFRTFNFDRDVAFLDDKLGPIRNATNPNLKAFKDRGGKLILYHGWNDPAVTPLSTVNYYQNVAVTMGEKQTSDFVSLYMVPGMQHCGNGPGPNYFGSVPSAQADPQFSMFSALTRWVENGTKPDKIIATKYKIDEDVASGAIRTRPLCSYPQVARYTGSGSTDDAANFKCVDGK